MVESQIISIAGAASDFKPDFDDMVVPILVFACV